MDHMRIPCIESSLVIFSQLKYTTLLKCQMNDILTSNKNATPIYVHLYLKDILNILSQRISGDFMKTKYRHHIDFISFNVKGLNVYTHAQF